MHSFRFTELILYVLPVIYYWLGNRYKHYLKYFTFYQLTLAEFLLPLLFVLIHAFGLIVFQFSLDKIFILICIMILSVLWYELVRRVEFFTYRGFIREATNTLFMTACSFLLGLIVLRWILIFL